MRESFMKYDRDNPPAGVDKRGKFTGADLVIRTVSGSDVTNTNLEIVKGSYEKVEKMFQNGVLPCVILDARYKYGDEIFGEIREAVAVGHSQNEMSFIFFALNETQDRIAYLRDGSFVVF